MSIFVHALLTWSVLPVGLVFLLVVASQYWPGRKAANERHRLIPLNEETARADQD